MKTTGLVFLTAGALVLPGCGREEAGLEGEEDRTGYEELVIAADTSEDFEEPGAAPVVPVQGETGPADVYSGGPLTATGNLRGVAENSTPGTITVTESDGGTTVLVDITRYTAGTTLAASIVRGECDRAGTPIARVGEPFTIGERGIATQQATIAVPTRQILDGRHSVRVHTPEGAGPEMVLACANLPTIGD